MRGIRAATQTGGGTIIAVPQHPWLWSRADDIAYHQRRYRRGELEAKLRRNGFEVLFSSSFTALLLPLMAASRLRQPGSEQDDGDRPRVHVEPSRQPPFHCDPARRGSHDIGRNELAGGRQPRGGGTRDIESVPPNQCQARVAPVEFGVFCALTMLRRVDAGCEPRIFNRDQRAGHPRPMRATARV